MYSEIKKIIESSKPDREKLSAIRAIVNANMPMREFMDTVKSGMGAEVEFEDGVSKMDAEALYQMIRESIPNPMAYAHVSPTDKKAMQQFILLNRQLMKFDFGGHFPSRSKEGNACYDITNPKRQTMSPERVTELGESLGIASSHETLIRVGSQFTEQQVCIHTKNGVDTTVRLVSQPNLFQWWAMPLDKTSYILCECRELKAK